LLPLLASLTMPLGVSVLPVPALRVSKVSLKTAVSPPLGARVPAVIVGVAVELVEPS
jgi:hypothetical protein